MLVTQENNLPMDRVKFSKSTVIDESKMELKDQKFYERASIEVWTNTVPSSMLCNETNV